MRLLYGGPGSMLLGWGERQVGSTWSDSHRMAFQHRSWPGGRVLQEKAEGDGSGWRRRQDYFKDRHSASLVAFRDTPLGEGKQQEDLLFEKGTKKCAEPGPSHPNSSLPPSPRSSTSCISTSSQLLGKRRR
ncbi:unnamed protein product [Lota lota]